MMFQREEGWTDMGPADNNNDTDIFPQPVFANTDIFRPTYQPPIPVFSL